MERRNQSSNELWLCPLSCYLFFLFHVSSFLISSLLSLLLASLCLAHSIFFTFFTNSYKYKEALGKTLILGCNYSLYLFWLSSLHYSPFYPSLYCLFLPWKIRDPGLPSCFVLDFVFQLATALHDTCSFNRLLLLFMVRLSCLFFAGFQLLLILNIASVDSLKCKLSHSVHSYEGLLKAELQRFSLCRHPLHWRTPSSSQDTGSYLRGLGGVIRGSPDCLTFLWVFWHLCFWNLNGVNYTFTRSFSSNYAKKHWFILLFCLYIS